MEISIFGLGYVGAVGLGCLSSLGHKVIGVDVNETKVNFINKGKSPIVEESIDKLIEEAYKNKKSYATTDVFEAVKHSSVSFICVGTPSTANGHLYLDGIYNVAKSIAEAIQDKESFHTIAIRSTVIPGTVDKVMNIVEEASGKKANVDFAIVSNPEFLREGTAVKDYFEPPFTLIGSECSNSTEAMKKIYEDINAPLYVTSIKVAELMKYVNNSFHALKVTFANEVGNICKKIGVDSHELMKIFSKDTKLNLSPYYLKPGFAYGGSCLPKDLKALKTIAHDVYLKSPVIESIEVSNDSQKNIVLEKIIDYDKPNIGFLGLSFKAGTDDLRNSPIVDVIETLLGKGYEIKIYDKNVSLAQLTGANKDYIMKRIPFISRFIKDDIKELLNVSDVIVIVNNEPEFKKYINDVDKEKIIYDLINVDYIDKSKFKNYEGICW